MQQLSVELLSAEAAAVQSKRWRRLADDCLEPNVFLELAFALAAARHLGQAPQFLLIWAGPRLVGVCPLKLPARFAPWPRIRVWTHEQAPLGTPLLERQSAAEVLSAIFVFCREHVPKAKAFLFPALPQDGPVARLLLSEADAQHRRILRFNVHQRAILSRDSNNDVEQSLGSKRRKNLESARRKLRAKGKLAFRLIGGSEGLGPEIEEFLALESKGWKGRRGTAFLKLPERAQFARAALGSLAAARKCRIARLDCGDAPIAMAIILQSGSHAYFWKIAYDEAFAAFSPGVLLTLELSRTLRDDESIALVDSCAAANHPMIDHLWRERLVLADFLIEITPRARGFSAAAAAETLRHELRSRAKPVVGYLRQLKSAILKRTS